MDCRAYCTATSYKLKPMFEFFRTRFKTTVFRDVLHVEFSNEKDSGDVFFFSYGAVVCWSLKKETEEQLLIEILPFEDQHREEVEFDEFTFTYGEIPKIADDEIVLPRRDVLAKIATSQGIAQSVKLGTFEIAIQKSFNQSKNIPENLAKEGRISLSRQEIRKKMGELFIERNSINLHVDVLDTPEFFWDYPELEPLYLNIANYLDIETRVEVLNHRLDVVHELFQMLNSELNHQHSSRLEWIIILLIVTEVLLSLMKDVFKIL